MKAAFLMAGHNPSYARIMVASVKRTMGCEVVQMSDKHTPQVPGTDYVQRIPFIDPLMCFRFQHIIAMGEGDLLLLDSDTVVKESVEHVFDKDFDVALTKRPVRVNVPIHIPYNSGVMFSRGPKFWEDCLAHTRTLDDNAQRWYADQVAIAHVAEAGKYNVLELQCEDYNWSPTSKEDVSDAKIWHFKGSTRKGWMQDLQSAYGFG